MTWRDYLKIGYILALCAWSVGILGYTAYEYPSVDTYLWFAGCVICWIVLFRIPYER